MRDPHLNRGTRRAGAGRWVGSLPLLFLLLALGACGTSTTDEQPRAAAAASTPAAPAAVQQLPVIARPDRRQRARFALLRTPPEGLPADVRRMLGTPTMGMSWRLAQRLPVNLSGAYWLVPGNGHLCVVDHGSLGNPAAGTACARTAQALAQGIASITVSRPAPGVRVVRARLIVGVAPDGAREIRIRTRGRVATAPVVDSIFVMRDTLLAPPDELSWR